MIGEYSFCTTSSFLLFFQNTFQVIIITDETYSFTIFTYKCGLLEWDNGVNIGYSADRDPYENYNPSSIDVACENSPNSEWNNVVYLLSDDNPDVTIGIRESVDSLCRDDADMPMPPYIRKACNRPNAAFVSLFR